MDPFSVVCGVAGLVGLAQVVIKEGYNYISTAKDAREDIRNLINEVAGLSGILVALQSLVDNLGKGITKHQQISECEDVLQKLKDLLQKINPTTKAKDPKDPKGTPLFRRKTNKNLSGNDPAKAKKTPITEKIMEFINNAGKITKWPLNKDETMELIDRLARHKATFILTLSADNTAKLIDILDKAKETNHHLLDVRSEQDRVAEEKREEDRIAKLCWLFPGDPDEKHIDTCKKRHKGTGGWFFDTKEFESWLCEPSWLFCHGKAGAGKTVLTSAVIDHIAHKFSDGDFGLAHIYCGYKDRDEQTPTKICASILRQLGFQKSELPSAIEFLHEKFKKEGKIPVLQDLIQAIISLASSFSSVWLFFDALDECAETTLPDLLSCIKDLMKAGIKGFVTSRSHVSEIRNTFEESITMELSAREEDIEMLVRSRLSTRSTPLAPKLVEEIVSRILKKADGIFLLAAFQVDFIAGKKRPTDVRKCLDRLPTGLEDTYKSILQRINTKDEDNKELALNTLSWISHTTRPLSPKELCEALTIAEGDTAIEDEDLLAEQDLVDVCGGLVIIDENSDTVRFVHYTVQEYLDKSLDVRGAPVHAMIAKTCLTYLSFDAFDECPASGMTTGWLVSRLNDNAFYEYAAQNWGYHTKSSDEESSVLEMICEFSGTGNHMQSALHVFLTEYSLLTEDDYELFNSRTTFSVAAITGLPRLTQSLLQLRSHEVDTRDSNKESYLDDPSDRTPLSRAAEHGHLTVVELLVNRDGVEVDSKGNDGRTPLSWAASNGHLAVVELLVNRDGVEVDSKDSIYAQTPLSRAASNGHLAVVELLVNRDDVEVNSKDNSGQTPLSWAASNGHLAVVELLVNRDGVEVDSKSNYGRTPLSRAASNGHLAVVELLVNRDGVEVDSKGNDSRTPLSRAASNGHLAVVELLVNRDGVEVDSKDSIYAQTPLSRAASNGHLAVVELLVNRDDVEVDSKDNNGQTPLSWAASNGHLAVVELLVNRDGVEVDSKDNNGRTPLSWAKLSLQLRPYWKRSGNEEVIELLGKTLDLEKLTKA